MCQAFRPNVAGLRSCNDRMMAGRLGFEPRRAESESAILPLDDLPIARSWGPKLLAQYKVAPTSATSKSAAELFDQAGKALLVVAILREIAGQIGIFAQKAWSGWARLAAWNDGVGGT